MQDAIEKLQQLVLDENKVVTYKTLCRTLDISANVAKRCLAEFYDQHGKKHGLSSYYLLIGKSQQCLKVAVVSGDELEKAKNQFSSLTSMHLYGVHKGNLMDENVLYNVDYGKTGQVEDYNRFSSISNPHIHVQAGQQLKYVAAAASSEKWKPSDQSNKAAQKDDGKKNVSSVKGKPPDLFSMFQKKNQENKNQTKGDPKQSVSESSPPVEKANKNSSSRDKSNVKYFFARQAEKNANSDVKNGPVKTAEKEPNGVQNMDADRTNEKKLTFPVSNTSLAANTAKKTHKVEKTKKVQKKQKRGSGNFSDDDFEPTKKKKHKRILTLEDSESESENEQAQDKAQRELLDPEPDLSASMVTDEDIIPPTPPIGDSKKKKWKVVTKTFVDDDGYFVTKKEKELVTDSEASDSENPSSSKPPPAKKQAHNQSPVKKKQASLMSFFGKPGQ